jgi:hypothetical protein
MSGRRTRTAVLTLAAIAITMGAAACSDDSASEVDDVTKVALLPQVLFPNGGAVTECPEPAADAPEDTTGTIPKAVCIEVENSTEQTVSYTLTVDAVEDGAEDGAPPIATVTLTTPPVAPGALGAVAVAAPNTERVIDAYADGQEDAQQAQGLVVANDVDLKVTSVVRTVV